MLLAKGVVLDQYVGVVGGFEQGQVWVRSRVAELAPAIVVPHPVGQAVLFDCLATGGEQQEARHRKRNRRYAGFGFHKLKSKAARPCSTSSAAPQRDGELAAMGCNSTLVSHMLSVLRCCQPSPG